MKKAIYFLIIALCVSCSIPTPSTPSVQVIQTAIKQTQDASIPESFKSRIMTFLTEGAKVYAMVSQGITYIELNKQVSTAIAAYDLTVSTWYEKFPKDSQIEFQKALEGWSLGTKLWSQKIENFDYPYEPDHYGYDKYVSYAGDKLIINKYSPGDRPKSNKKWINWSDENISILLSLGSNHFELGKQMVLKILK